MSSLENGKSDGWYSLVKLADKTVKFKLDTGAKANIIPKSLFNKLPNQKLRETSTTLTTFANLKVKPLGKVKISCQSLNNDEHYELDFYIVNFQCTPLLGLKACEKLKLIKQISAVEKEYTGTMNSVLPEYSHLFEGLGKVDGTYHIEIDKSIPPVVYSKRNVPYTIRQKLKALALVFAIPM